MSVLIIGGDKIDRLASLIQTMGATKAEHWCSRRKSQCHREIPANTDAIIMLIDYLNHSAMSHFKRHAKKRGIPYTCVKRGTASVCKGFTSLCQSCTTSCLKTGDTQ